MRKFMIALFAFLPMLAMAQSKMTAEQQLEEAKRAQAAAKQAVKEAKAAAKKAAKAKKLQEKAAAEMAKAAKIKAQAEAQPTQVGAQPTHVVTQPTQSETKPVQQVEVKPTQAEAPKNGMSQSKVTQSSVDTQQGSSSWYVPKEEPKPNKVAAKVPVVAGSASDPDAKYLAGTVPEENGKIVFTLDLDAPGQSAETIYGKLYNCINSLTKGEDELPESAIALVNPNEHIIAARFKEWLVFTNNFLSLDRTEFNFTLIANCTDGHAHVTMERMSYSYEEDRPTGFHSPAEDIISDKAALNKKGTKINKVTGKFRRKTIDRKDAIFQALTQALNK